MLNLLSFCTFRRLQGGVSTYAKACKTAPASFSITPQQVSTAVVTPVDSNLYTKTFLQSVRGVTDTCTTNHERYVIFLTLIVYSTEYSVVEVSLLFF